MAIPGYRTWRDRILGRKIVYDLLLALTACFAGAASALRAYGAWLKTPVGDDWDYYAAWLFGLGGATITVIALWKFVVEWIKANHEESVHDLEGCLHALHAVLLGEAQGNEGLRLTIHVPTDGGRQLQQTVDYIGDQRSAVPKTAGRKFAAQSGVIGEAYRTGELSVGQWEGTDYNALIAELVKTWRYTEPDALKLDRSSRAWLAAPLAIPEQGRHVVVAVIYADSTQCTFFSDARVSCVLFAAEGIARFAQRRYK